MQHVGPLAGGGIATVVVSLVEALRDLPELEVEAVASTALGGLGQKLATAMRADRSLRRGGPRIVHLHTASGISFWRKAWLLDAARAAGARTVLHVHGGAFESFVTQARSIARGRIEHAMAVADHLLAVNEAQRCFLEGRFQRAVELLPNAVTLPSMVEPPSAPPFRWLHLARLGRAKGTWDLLTALEHLSSSTPWQALLVGDGDLEEAKRRAARLGGRVEVLGWRSQAEVAALLRSVHALVLPSYLEGLPMSVLEAMAAGRAVIATPVGGLPQLIRDGVNGRLVPLRDPAALASAMEELMSKRELCASLGAAGRLSIAEGHDIRRVAERLRDLYLELAGDSRR